MMTAVWLGGLVRPRQRSLSRSFPGWSKFTVVSVLVSVLVLDGPRWRARSDGGVGCRAIVLVLVRVLVSCVFGAQFAGCEGNRRRSSRSESAAGVRASGKWGGDEESRDGESGDGYVGYAFTFGAGPLVAGSSRLRT
jgi:hypothetical protein